MSSGDEIAALREKLGQAARALACVEGLGEPWLHALLGDLARLEQLLAAQASEQAGLKALTEVAGIINSSLKLPEVLSRVMDQIIRLTGAERAFLVLLDEATGQLEFQAARNLDRETITDSAFEISRSVVERVARGGEPVVTTNAQLDPRFSQQQSVLSYNLRSILCVPLRVRERIIGAIYADSRIRTGIFGERDRDLLIAFADQAAVAIENARLFENVTAAKALMDNVFASIASGVITTDAAGRIGLLNRAAEGILGLSQVQVEGRSYHEALPALTPVLEPLMEQVCRDGCPVIGQEVEPDLPERGRVILNLSLSSLRATEDDAAGLALVVDDLTERRRMERLQRYVSPAVVRRLLEDPGSLRLGGQRQEVTILFADIRGFTTFSERRDAEEIVSVLNGYLAIGAEAVLAEDGTLDKFMGDAVMAIFGAPLPQPDHTLRAVRAALRIRDAVREHHRRIPGAYLLNFGIGIAVGPAVVGNVGTARQLNYTAIGSSVNLAHRLQSDAAGGQILLEHAAYEQVQDQVEVRPLPPLQIKGLSAPVQVHDLVGLR